MPARSAVEGPVEPIVGAGIDGRSCQRVHGQRVNAEPFDAGPCRAPVQSSVGTFVDAPTIEACIDCRRYGRVHREAQYDRSVVWSDGAPCIRRQASGKGARYSYQRGAAQGKQHQQSAEMAESHVCPPETDSITEVTCLAAGAWWVMLF